MRLVLVWNEFFLSYTSFEGIHPVLSGRKEHSFCFNVNCISSPWSEGYPPKIQRKGGLLNFSCGAENVNFNTQNGE